MLDGEVIGGPYDGFVPGGVLFSPDSQHVAAAVKIGNQRHMVVDGTLHQDFPTVMSKSWEFSHDSQKIIYVAGVEGSIIQDKFVGKAAVVVDREVLAHHDHNEQEKNGMSPDTYVSNEVYVSPDSSTIAYLVRKNGKYSYFINEQQQGIYEGIASGRGNPEWEKHPGFANAGWKRNGFVFSPDSEHHAYGMVDGAEQIIIYDGQEHARHDSIIGSVNF